MKRFARKVPSRLLLSAPLVGVLWAVTLPAWAAPPTELQNLQASDAAEFNEFFGIAIDLSGDTAVVGADFDDNAFVFRGARPMYSPVTHQPVRGPSKPNWRPANLIPTTVWPRCRNL